MNISFASFQKKKKIIEIIRIMIFFEAMIFLLE
jgi:hypothetical protein